MASSNLEGKTIVVVGGSSGIGYGVAKAALLEGAGKVVIGSSSQEKISNAIQKLRKELAVQGKSVPGEVAGEVIDAHNSASVRQFFEKTGEIDHLVWTSGDPLRLGYLQMDLDKQKGAHVVDFRLKCQLMNPLSQTPLTFVSGDLLSLHKSQRLLPEVASR